MVVLGHLPVRASLWVRQYACQSARKRSEVVALLRTAGDSVAVDLITGGERSEIESIGDIGEAMTVAANAAGRVIVRVDETAEPELLEREGVDEVTILTGADEAAVVASYRLIKSLVSTLENRLDPDVCPVLRVAVMGGSGQDIQTACAKIERACRAFLDRPIEVLDASGRIDATGTTSVCRLDQPGVANQAIDALLGMSVEPAWPAAVAGGLRLADAGASVGAPSEHAQTHAPEVVVVPGIATRMGLADDDEPVAEMQAKPGNDIDPAGFVRASNAADGTVPAAKLGVSPPELIDGLVPLESRCPVARGAWFAADEAGGLHVVIVDEGTDPVASLVAARAWAYGNLGLLLLAEPGLAMPSAASGDRAQMPLHLLSRSPSKWRGVLDSEVRVYAVAAVTVAGEEHLVATALND